MTAREFVQIVKKHAVDGIAESLVDGPRRLAERPLSAELPAESKFMGGAWVDQAIVQARGTMQWLSQLSEEDRKRLQSLLRECSEISVASFFNVLDGTGGDFEGVFEVYAVTEEDRVLVNPQNTEMLHDVFSELCQENGDDR